VIGLLPEIGDRYSRSPGQVALRWLIENPIVLPIPGAKNGKQAADNAVALTFSLTPEEVDALSLATLAWCEFLFMEPSSPKRADLERDGRYVLHGTATGDQPWDLREFLVEGTADG
jgi:hypothetical protein